MDKRCTGILACIALLGLCGPLAASAKPAPEDDAKAEDGPYAGLEFRLLGPAIGGRMTAVAGVPGQPNLWYAAAAQGGVWKSTDGGHAFEPIFDASGSNSVGALAIAPSDPNVIYVGGGEANPRGNVQVGRGIWKSTDAGQNWSHVWQGRGQIGRMIVHPRDAELVYAAVLGSPFGPNPERGVYRSRDGGKSWTQVLKVDADTGASDIAFDPQNPRILFAGMWQMRRTPWSMQSGGPGSGLYRSSDGGDSWSKVEAEGLPGGEWGKVGVAVAPTDSQRVYALIEAKRGGLFRSDDGGASFERVNRHRALRQRAWYYTTMTIDPRDPNIVWFPQVPMLKTIDGGKTLVSVSGFHHGDHHDLWIDPADPRRLIAGHDGGIDISTDGGSSWRQPALPLAQFYNIGVDARSPWRVGGTIQDMGTAMGPSRSRNHEGIGLGEWRYAGGGEAGDFVFDPARPGEMYAGEYSGIITHYVEGSGQFRNVLSWPGNPSGWGAEWARHRFQWTAPIHHSKHPPHALYHGAEVLFRSLDQGQNWDIVSPDLTRNDKSKQKWTGGPITGDNTGVEIYDTIFSIAESPLQQGLLWVGSDDGLLHLSRDDGQHWDNLTPRRAWPEWGTIEAIEASHTDPGVAYIAVDAHRLDDGRPYLYRASDYGRRIERIVDGLPADMPILSVRQDPVAPADGGPRLLYAGGERGLFLSRDDGASWQPLQLNLPPVAVTDLEIAEDDLVVATRGRALWVLDDLSVLRQWTPRLHEQPLHLYAAAPTHHWHGEAPALTEGLLENPPDGAVLHYWLKDKPAGALKLEIRDSAGVLVRTLTDVAEPALYPVDDPDDPTSKPEPELSTEPGLHRITWDLRHQGASRFRTKLDAGNPQTGPRVLPGRYSVQLGDGTHSASTIVEVGNDPLSQVPLAEQQQRVELALALRDLVETAQQRATRLRAIRRQALRLARELPADDAGYADARRVAGELARQARELESRIHNPEATVVYDVLAGRRGGARFLSQLAPLLGTLDDTDHGPTMGVRQRAAELNAEWVEIEAALRSFESGPVKDAETVLGALPRFGVP